MNWYLIKTKDNKDYFKCKVDIGNSFYLAITDNPNNEVIEFTGTLEECIKNLNSQLVDRKDSLEFCPYCCANLKGAEIPKESQKNHGGRTHGSRKFGIYDMYKDRTVMWVCPDCKGEWDRV